MGETFKDICIALKIAANENIKSIPQLAPKFKNKYVDYMKTSAKILPQLAENDKETFKISFNLLKELVKGCGSLLVKVIEKKGADPEVNEEMQKTFDQIINELIKIEDLKPQGENDTITDNNFNNNNKSEKEKLEKEREEKERLEKERLEKERLEKERLEKERLEKERVEKERLEKERVEKDRMYDHLTEEERLEQQRVDEELERMERERLEMESFLDGNLDDNQENQENQEKEQKEREEKERLERERKEEREEQERKQRLEKERLEKEKLEKERLENERKQKEEKEKERLEKEKERLEKEQKEKQERERLDKERQEKEKEEKERLQKERIEKEKNQKEKERLKKEKSEKERLENEKKQKEEKEKERLEKLDNDKKKEKEEDEKKKKEEQEQKEKQEKGRLEEERLEKEKQERLKKEKEQIQKEQQKKEQMQKEEDEKEEELKRKEEEEKLKEEQKEEEEQKQRKEQELKEKQIKEEKEQKEREREKEKKEKEEKEKEKEKEKEEKEKERLEKEEEEKKQKEKEIGEKENTEERLRKGSKTSQALQKMMKQPIKLVEEEKKEQFGRLSSTMDIKRSSVISLKKEVDNHGLTKSDQEKIEKLIKGEILEEDFVHLSEEIFFVETKSNLKDLSKYIEVNLKTAKNKNSQIIFKEKLNKVSQHYSSTRIQKDAGTPTSFFVREPYIMIGTDYGFMLRYDSKNEDFKLVIGSNEKISHKSVTSISISKSGQVMACGYEDGAIVFWNIEKNDAFKTVTCHSSPVVGLKFVGEELSVVSLDSNGEVYHNSLSDIFFVYYCSTTQVCEANPVLPCLALDAFYSPISHPFASTFPIAVSNTNETYVYSIEPLQLLATIPKPQFVPPGSFPFLSWLKPENTQDTPYLAVAWGSNLEVYYYKNELSSKFHLLIKTQFDANITGMIWLEKAIVVLTADTMKLYDPFESIVLESQYFDKRLVSHDFFSKNYNASSVSEHNSVICDGHRIYFLEKESLFQIRILKWEERLNILMNKKCWSEALLLIMDLYEGSKDLFGVSLEKSKRKEKAIENLFFLFPKYINEKVQTDKEVNEYIIRASVCIDYCQRINRKDFLFKDIYKQFCELGHEETFLEMLEPFILADKLTYLEPTIMRKFVDHYKKMDLLKHVEHCVIHLDAGSMDLKELEKLCLENNLFSAFIYINTCQKNYLAPLSHFFLLLDKDSQKYENSILGYLLMIYLSRILAGKTFPSGRIEQKEIEKVKKEVVQFLFKAYPVSSSSSKTASTQNKKYGNIQALLKWDTKRALSVVAITLKDDFFMDSSPINHSVIFNILNSLFIDESVDPYNVDTYQSSSVLFTNEQIVHYLIMISKFVGNESIEFSEYMINRIIGALTLIDEDSSFQERQQCLFLFLKSFPPQKFQQIDLLEYLKQAAFYEILEWYYLKKKDFKNVIIWSIQGSYKVKEHCFSVLRSLLNDPTLGEQESTGIKNYIISQLQTLIQIDGEATSLLIIDLMGNQDHNRLVQELSTIPERQFQYLQGIMVARKKMGVINEEGENIQATFQITDEMMDLYVKLMCQFAPQQVYSFLQETDIPNLESILRLCKKHSITDAVIFLMERTGDAEGALNELLSSLGGRLDRLTESYKNIKVEDLDDQKFPKTLQEEEVMDLLKVAIQLCERNAKEYKGVRNEALWFKILDALMVPLSKVKDEKKEENTRRNRKLESVNPSLRKLKNSITFYLREILHIMMGYVELGHVLEKIVQDHGRDQFGDFKSTIIAVLETFNYEDNILRTTKKLLSLHMHKLTSTMTSIRQKAYCSKDERCRFCAQTLSSNTNLFLFSCGHSFHKTCFEQQTKKRKNMRCPICNGDIKEKTLEELKEEKERKLKSGDNDNSSNNVSNTTTMNLLSANITNANNAFSEIIDYLRDLEKNEVPRFRILKGCEREDSVYDYNSRLNLSPFFLQRSKFKIKPRRPGTLDPKPKNTNVIPTEDSRYMFDFRAAKGNKKFIDKRKTTFYY